MRLFRRFRLETYAKWRDCFVDLAFAPRLFGVRKAWARPKGRWFIESLLHRIPAFAMLPPLAAFALMALVCALSTLLALLANAQSLALVGFAGAFATPILLSTGQGSHVALFGYYLLLNVAIGVVAWLRAWSQGWIPSSTGCSAGSRPAWQRSGSMSSARLGTGPWALTPHDPTGIQGRREKKLARAR